ncbi:hypothetical protein ABPG75_010829 [Micractinium tetrahymenae]
MAEPAGEVPAAEPEQQQNPDEQRTIPAAGDGAAAQDVPTSGSQGGDGGAAASGPAAGDPVAAVGAGEEAAAEVKAKPPAAPEAAAAPAEAKLEPEAAQEQGAAEHAAPKDEPTVKEEGGEEGGAKEPPSDEAVVARLRALLAEVDLATTTEKQLRKRLEGEFGVQLGDRKALLRAEINAYLEAQPADDEEEEEVVEEEEEEEERPSGTRKRKGGAGFGDYISPEMQEFLGEERLPRTQVVKRLWAYIKEKELQDPADKRNIIFDDALKKLFPGTKTTMFKLQKLLSRHCKTADVVGGSEEEGEEDGDEEEGAAPAAKRARRASSGGGAAKSRSGGGGGRRKSKGGGEEGGEGKQRKPGGFTKECRLSDELAAWIGKPTASRPEITKFFWEYAKTQDLKDPSDKSYILADDALQRLTGESRFKGFSFAKFIKAHILGYADAEGGGGGGGDEDEAE